MNQVECWFSILVCKVLKKGNFTSVEDLKRKIGLFCNIDKEAVITAKDVDCIYEVPLVYNQEGLDEIIVTTLNIWSRAPKLQDWQNFVDRYKNALIFLDGLFK